MLVSQEGTELNSVILRGIVTSSTFDVIRSIKRWHDGEIILSTWEGDLPVLPVDKIVLSKDPGKCHVHNVKRQITLAKAGVDAAEGEKVLLTRTDVMHAVDCFENIKDGKITLLDFFTINPDFYFCPLEYGVQSQCTPQHRAFFKITDFVQWGYASEIKAWASQSVKDLLFQYAETYPYPESTVEQMWCVAFLSQRGYDISIESLLEAYDLRWTALTDNFVLMSHHDMGVKILKPAYRDLDGIRSRPWCLTSDIFNFV